MNKIESLMQTLIGSVKVLAFLTIIVTFIPVVAGYRRLRPQDPYRLPKYFHRFLLWLFGFTVRVHGVPSQAAPVFFVCNHTSYLDIPVLGALLPASFVAKSEVASWPLFGYLAKLQNSIFIERRAARAATQRSELQDHIAQRKNLILFPEGTSTEGLTALPFKSSLFSIVEQTTDVPVTVQPVSLTCTGLDGMPLLHEDRALYAWYGDMTMPPHLWGVFKRGAFTVDVVFHPPLSPRDFPDRKALAAACHAHVARGIEQSLAGRIDQAALTYQNA